MISWDRSLVWTHLWQSTLCVAIAWLLTLTLHKNRAALRYWIWFAASVKFLVPFSALVEFGSRLGWQSGVAASLPRILFFADEIGQRFAPPKLTLPHIDIPQALAILPAVLIGLWFCGSAARLALWLRWWWRIRSARRTASPLNLNLAVPALVSAARLEPGVAGIFKPILLLPQGIMDRLTPAQLETVLKHEMCHVRRRDNLTGAIHMLVETIFWFHPLVWWISLRLVDERERACDEEVCSQGCEPRLYAEAILDVCRFHLEWSRLYAAGVTGADLKKRIARIIDPQTVRNLHFGKKLLLAAAGLVTIAAPVAVGILEAPPGQAQPSGQRSSFEVASLKPANPDNHRHWYPTLVGDRFTLTNATLKTFIELAYNVRAPQISGGPGWTDSDKYDLEAKADGRLDAPRMRLMLQSLLADRFKLVLHHESKEEPLYELVIAKGGPKLTPAAEHTGPGSLTAGKGTLTCRAAPVSWLPMFLSGQLNRYVVDKTGLSGEYDFTLHWTPDLAQSPDAPDPSIFTALQEQLGLQLKSAKGPVDVLVIDQAQKPSEN